MKPTDDDYLDFDVAFNKDGAEEVVQIPLIKIIQKDGKWVFSSNSSISEMTFISDGTTEDEVEEINFDATAGYMYEDYSGNNNQEIKIEPTKLDLIDSSGNIIATSNNDIVSPGRNTAKFSGLTKGKTYRNVSLAMVDHHEKLFSDKFTFTVDGKLNLVDEIIDANVLEKYPTGFKFDFTSKNDESSDPKVLDYSVQVTADGYNYPIYTSKQFKVVGKNEVTVDTLVSDKKYTNVNIQLLREDGTTLIGEPYLLAQSITTPPLNKINGIDDINITSFTSDGFKFDMDLSLWNEPSTPEKKYTIPYGISVFANGDLDNPIWKTEEDQDLEKQEVVVTGLDKDIVYSDIEVQITSPSGDKKYGTMYDTKTDIITTGNVADSISDFSLSNVSHTSFDVELKVNGIIEDEELSSPYKIEILSEGNHLWTSDILTKVGTQSLTINNLKPNSKYNNVTIRLLDISNQQIGEDVLLSNFVSLKFTFVWWIILLMVLGLLLIIGIIVALIIFFNRKEDKDEFTTNGWADFKLRRKEKHDSKIDKDSVTQGKYF